MESTSIYPHAHAESSGLLGSADISAVCRHFSSHLQKDVVRGDLPTLNAGLNRLLSNGRPNPQSLTFSM
jgi:hypothetical protein